MGEFRSLVSEVAGKDNHDADDYVVHNLVRNHNIVEDHEY